MVVLLLAVIALAAVELLVWRYGVDSRDGKDWVTSTGVREGPRTR